LHDVIIVGTGASGVAAALELCDRGVKPLVLDVGYPCDVETTLDRNLYDHRRQNDVFDLMIGAEYEGLSNLLTGADVPVKLTAPFSRYVTRDVERLGPISATNFGAIQSFSRGGLANVWGAGLYRFVDADLSGFPISSADLDPYFDRLTQHIGIAGVSDDLARYFGSVAGLSAPLPLSRNISRFYGNYQRRKKTSDRIHVGRARIAVHTNPDGDQPPYRHNSLEFFQEDRSLYSPRYTLDELLAKGAVDIEDRVLVKTWSEKEDRIVVTATDVSTNEIREFACKTLILAAGAINTARIVLASASDHETKLPLLENPALQFPLVLPFGVGQRLDTNAFGLVQLNLVWNSKTFDQRIQGSIMEITAPSRAEFFGSFPLSARANLGLIRQLLPGMILMQLFFPGHALEPASLSLLPDGSLSITGAPNSLDFKHLRPLLKFLRRLGALTLPQLVVRVPTGHAVHYTSTLPMRHDPQRYQCHADGRLSGTRSVYIADSACFSSLPAKNMSFGMMANAMRIARAATVGHS
jgi:choline dehydrogenase-like flavoprotein